MSKLSKDILGKIKKQNVVPKSKWHFHLLRGLIWSAVIFTLIFAALSSAIVIRHLWATDWELARSISESSIQSILGLLPYMWLIVIALIIFVGDRLFKKTRKGHRFSALNVLLASLILSLVLGTGFFATNADQPFENAIRKNFKPYEMWEIRKHKRLVAPDRGAIAGKVEEIDGEKITIRDFKDREWTVETDRTYFHDKRTPDVGDTVGIMGERLDESHFKAHRVKYWEHMGIQREELKRKIQEAEIEFDGEKLREFKVLRSDWEKSEFR